jgi:membrane fusion protein, heavy metal efflux system
MNVNYIDRTTMKSLNSKSGRLIFLVAGIVLFSCGQNATKIQEDREENPGIVYITTEQFTTSFMKVGSFEKQSFSQTIRANGYVDVPPERKASVSVKLGGFVKALSILPGEKVAQGAVLFTLENPEFIRLQQDYLEAKAQLKYLESDYERQKALASDNITSQKNFLKAESDFKVTQAKVNALGEQLKLLNINLQKLESGSIESTIGVYSPISGYISMVNINRGKYVAAQDVAVEIVNTDHKHVELQIFEKDIVSIREGQNFTFSLPGSGNGVHFGEVYLVGKTIENATRTVNVHGHIENEEEIKNLLPGMYVEAYIDISSSESIVLPSDAVVSLGDEHYVLLQTNADNTGYTFVRKAVAIGKVTNQWTEIKNSTDFKPDDLFLVKGAFNLIMD